MLSFFQKLIATPARLAALVFLVYFASSFFSANIREVHPQRGDAPLWYRNNFWVVASTPRILRGDEMYYLMMAHSLAGDGDLYLSDEYTSVHNGGPEMGVYHSNRAASNFFQHFSRDTNFTLLGNHPFGLSAFLSMLLWPWAGSAWVEAGAIWVTVLCGLMGVVVFLRVLEAMGIPWLAARNAALALAFATPWWSYSRTLYTEVYIGTGLLISLLGVLKNRAVWALPLSIGLAWFKYPALLLFFGAGLGEAVQRRWRHFFLFGAIGAMALAGIYAFNQAYFEDARWYTRTEPVEIKRSAARAAAPIAWIPGEIFNNIERLFTDFDKGLFPHCPLLLVACVGLWAMPRRQRRHFWLIMTFALPWALIHISYRFLMSGESYTTRYLVPVVPLLMLGLPFFWQWSEGRSPWWCRAGLILLIMSAINNTLAGILPAIAFDSTPLEVMEEFAVIIKAAITGSVR